METGAVDEPVALCELVFEPSRFEWRPAIESSLPRDSRRHGDDSVVPLEVPDAVVTEGERTEPLALEVHPLVSPVGRSTVVTSHIPLSGVDRVISRA